MVSVRRWELPGSLALASSADNTVLDPAIHQSQRPVINQPTESKTAIKIHIQGRLLTLCTQGLRCGRPCRTFLEQRINPVTNDLHRSQLESNMDESLNHCITATPQLITLNTQ